MKLTRISKYGFQVDNKDVWYNYDKSFSSRLKLEHIGKEIGFRENKQGAVVQIVLPKQETTKKEINSLLVKVIVCRDPDYFEKALNNFGETHEVVATQTHYNSGDLVAVMYYKVVR